MTDAAIVAEGIGKRFGPVLALDGVDLVLPAGGVLGLLGPNGAGKTTLVRILATLLRPDRGRARVAGFDVAEQPQAVRRLIGLLGLTSAAGRLVRTYSGGMRRRLDVAASLLAAPPVLFLDEPTTGLDPRGRRASSPRWPAAWPPPGCTSAGWPCVGPSTKKHSRYRPARRGNLVDAAIT